MGASFGSWWQKVRKPQEIALLAVGCILLVGLLVVIALAYLFNLNVPGLHGKTIWDWLQLLIIPLGLAAIAFLFQRANTRTEQKIAAVRYEQDQIIALDKQRENLLQIYLDRMSELLLEKGLRTSERGSEARMVARARTITILFQLDARRIGYVFAFLRDAGLSKSDNSIVSFYAADLKKINLSNADLSGANLHGANLYEANLVDATLNYADLSNAHLNRAELRNSDFGGANLFEASFQAANLTNAFFANTNCSFASFNDAKLSRADFRGANLSEADFENANLTNADFRDANFTKAFLAKANLTGAKVTEEQLENVRSLKGATMPDGSIHP